MQCTPLNALNFQWVAWEQSNEIKKKGEKKSFKDWKHSEHICFSLVFIDHAVREEMSVVSLSLGVTWPLLLNPIKRNLSLHPNVMLRKIYTISMKDQMSKDITWAQSKVCKAKRCKDFHYNSSVFDIILAFLSFFFHRSSSDTCKFFLA